MEVKDSKEVDVIKKTIEDVKIENVIKKAIDFFGINSIALASSLSIEDQVLTHLLLSANRNASIFVIDTGRFFEETYQTMEETEKKYNFKYKLYFPEYEKVEKMVNEHGINLFYKDIKLRKLCCQVRKVEPLKRALSNLKCWVCGLRREQSITRQNVDLIEWDNVNNLYKLNPLYNWTEKEVWNFIKKYDIPYNKLYNRGFKSIGCAPCTRAIKEGEDLRSGRWWWEDPEHKECGLHKR